MRGRISALIELGAGFHPEISGRENVFINGIMLGLTKREITRRFDEIVEFAEMKEFIDAPVKTYSSGMYMRLGFAVAIHVDPDVLLVDEVLAVGDEGFTHKCLDKFAEFKRRGKTILLVTHSLGLVERFCDEALWLDGGAVKGMGDPKRVVGAYITDVEASEEEQLAAADARAQESAIAISPDEPAAAVLPDNPIETATGPADMFRATEGRWGSREVEITDVALVGADGERGHVFHTGERLDVRIRMRAPLAIDDFVVGIGLFNAEGVCCYGTNTSIEELKGRADLRRRRGGLLDRQPRPGRGHLQARRRGAQDGRLPVRLSPAAAHVPRQVAHQGRRHLPPAAHLAVLGVDARSRGRTNREGRGGRDGAAPLARGGGVAGGSAARRVEDAWSSPTASSICCTPATCAISRPRARSATR